MLACLDYLLAQGVPPRKISLGLAGYSDWWYPTYDEQSGARVRGSDIPYTRARELLAVAGVTATWDSVQMAPTAMWEAHGVFQHLWLEDARAFMAKRQLAVQKGLRGYSVWLLGSEDPAVWSALRQAAPTHR
jgi:spore germination protein YaaH